MRKTLLTAVVSLAAVFGGSAQAAPKDAFFTASDGAKLHYLEEGRGTPVILLHGYTGSAQGNWYGPGIAQALAANHRVIAINARGHGMSDKPHDPARYASDRMPSDVLELMDSSACARTRYPAGVRLNRFAINQAMDEITTRLRSVVQPSRRRK